MGIKELYQSMEDKWYEFIDKIDSKVPVYGVIDRIDSVVPSFALFLIIIIFLILFLGLNLYFAFEPYNATFTISDYQDNPVNDSVINFKIINPDGSFVEERNERTNENGELKILGLSYGQIIDFNINLNKGTYDEEFEINTKEFIETIKLKQKITLKPVTKTIFVRGANNLPVSEPIQLEFSCDNSNVSPTPTSAYTVDGQIKVTEPVNCLRLLAKVNDEKYENRQYHINTITYPLNLQTKEIPKVDLTIKIKENDFPANGTFNIRLSGENDYTKTTASATEKFSVIPGEYYLSINDPNRNFGSVTKTINITTNKTEEITVSKTIKANIFVNVIDRITGEVIDEALVHVKNSKGKLIDKDGTNENGEANFALTDTGDFTITAKKVGGVEEGYFAKEIEIKDLQSDTNITLELEKITTQNAGRVKVTVVDQDGEAVSNAKIMLKYTDETIVELNEINNYILTDINGEASFLAGKVEGKVFAYANKYPFLGSSNAKNVSLEEETNFEVIIEIGQTKIDITAKDEKGEEINGEAQLFTLDDKEVSGLISIENGKGSIVTKAGKNVYLVIRGENTKTYYSEVRFLWPSKTEKYDVKLLSEINEPKIVPSGQLKIYNENGQIVRTMKAGNKYYALLDIETDKEYSNVLMHYRAGTEKLLENDYIQINNIETHGNFSETRGTSYDPERGYDFDSDNLTDSLAKWITIKWDNLTTGIHVVKVNFKIKKDTPANKELQFFWRASFDGEKKPASNANEELYDQTYASNIYFEGEEALCTENFCITGKWLYDTREELYIDSPFTTKQAQNYNYHYQIINNSNTNYGTNDTPVSLTIEMLSENGTGSKITSFEITDPKGELSGESVSKINDYEIKSFEKSTAIDNFFVLQGNNVGNSILRTSLKSEGRIIFSEEEGFNVPTENEMNVTLDKTFIPSLIDTEIVVSATDTDNEPLNEAIVNVYAKEPGFDEYLVFEGFTNRLGKAIINTGAHFPNTKVIIEIAKAGYQRTRYEITVSEEVLGFNPSTIGITLNTTTKREEIIPIEIANVTGKDLEIYSIKMISDFQGVINEGALNSYLTGLRGEIIKAEETTDLDLIRIRLDNGLTEETMLEPISINGNVVLTTKAENTSIIFDNIIPFNLSVGSGANPAAACLKANIDKANLITERGKVTFYFDLINGCIDEETGTGLNISEIKAMSTGEISGMAELSMQSYTTANGGRTALDGINRRVFGKLNANEKVRGSVTYIPDQEAIGKTQTINVVIEGQYQGQKVTTEPTPLTFKADVINLKDCLRIDSKRSAVDFTEESSVTIDATNCLGQDIDIWLCQNDPGCSGGAPEGKISLSKPNVFSINNTSETINVTAQDLPGTYGVTVSARIKGKSSWNYIGEVPVSFRETDDKFFNLSKSEVNIIGEGMQDTILLTNKMLDHTVKVNATDCIWGWKEPEVNWLQVLGGAALGATIGGQIGKGIEGIIPENDKPQSNISEANQEAISKEMEDVSAGETKYIHKNKNDQVIITDSSDAPEGYTNVGSITNISNDQVTAYKWEGVGSDVVGDMSTVSRAGASAAEVGIAGYTAWKLTGWATDRPDSFTPSTSPKSPLNQTQPDNTTGTLHTTNTSSANISTETANNELNTLLDSPELIPLLEENNIDYIQDLANSGDSQAIEIIEIYNKRESEIKTKEPKSIFAMLGVNWNPKIENTLPKISFGAGQGWGTILGAIAGAYASWYSQQASCSDNSQTVAYNDYVIFLQGENRTITPPAGSNNTEPIEQTITGDAQGFGFSLGGVGVNWDHTNADYSSEEHTGIKFTNNGINEPSAKYATLTINASMNKHGSAPISLEEDSSESDYDVICKKPTFGQYWIGEEEDQGDCSGISQGTYSQKHHIRVVSGEPKVESAKIKKAKTCNNGILVGSTGPEAIPRVEYEWDWSNVPADMCDYGNPDYVYCDGTQYLITLTKKLAALQEFFRINQSATCPDDPVLEEAMLEFEEINSITAIVPSGFIGVSDTTVIVDRSGIATATITVENNAGEDVDSILTYTWKGEGEPVSNYVDISIPSGESITVDIEQEVPEWNDVYFFTAVTNGVRGNRLPVTRAFHNFPNDMECWAQKTTRAVGGVPSISYYFINEDAMQWTSRIPDSVTLYNYINHGVYLMRENYSDDLLKDFKEYYTTQAFQVIDQDEMEVLEKLSTNDFAVVKRFSNQTSFEAGLYDVWINIDFMDSFDIQEEGTYVESSLLLIRTPAVDSPLYKMPFDGPIGEHGRTSYGTTYTNETDTELGITDELLTQENAIGNGVVNIITSYDTSFEKINSSLGTRGQLASITFDGSQAQMLFTPNYATPVIGKYTLNGTEGAFTFEIERNYQGLTTGGNLSYWTGAARSRDFFGASASEVYNNSADNLINEEYGFRWTDATNDGTIYLKTIFYTPANNQYVLRTTNGSFWTPNTGFSTQIELEGIGGMSYNQAGQTFDTLEELYEMVANQDVCISSDGEITTFWWNPKVLETIRGPQGSLSDQELTLAGVN